MTDEFISSLSDDHEQIASAVRCPARSFSITPHMLLDFVAIADATIVAGGAVLSLMLYLLIFPDRAPDTDNSTVVGIVTAIVFHQIARTQGLYRTTLSTDWTKRIHVIAVAVGFSFLLIIACAYMFKLSSNLSRGWLLTWVSMTLALQVLLRVVLSRALSMPSARSLTQRRLAVVTDHARAPSKSLADALAAAPGLVVTGTYRRSKPNGSIEAPAADDLDALIAGGQRGEFDEIVIDLDAGGDSSITSLIDHLSLLPADVWLCPPNIAMPIKDTISIAGVNLLHVRSKPLQGWGVIQKAALDYVVTVGCLVLFAVPMLAIAIAIKLDSPGPVFFRQRRHGFNHRIIKVVKFRTMTCADDGKTIVQAQNNDPRVTRVGRFLRKTSLDELPQLFNVLLGEMSLVGPRPHALTHNDHFRDRLDHYANRHRVKPGITGWAQINGYRGPTEDVGKMRRRVEMDLYYIENWSLLFDLRILLATTIFGFVHPNAV